MSDPEEPRQEEEDHDPGDSVDKSDDAYPDTERGDITPGPGGYDGRDPATDMPRVPSAPETQDE